MRTRGFVLAIAMVLAPSLSYSQTQRASDQPNAHAATTTADPVEARADSPAANTASERRSLMGMVMDVLIASAEQQSALQKSAHHADQANANAALTATATPVTSTKPASASDLATREQIAVESEP